MSSTQTTCQDNTIFDSPECIAQLLGKSKQWVIRQSRAGKIPSHRVGKSYGYVRAEIEAFAKGDSHGKSV